MTEPVVKLTKLEWTTRWFVVGKPDGSDLELREAECAHDPERGVYHVRTKRGETVYLESVPEEKACATEQLAIERLARLQAERGNKPA